MRAPALHAMIPSLKAAFAAADLSDPAKAALGRIFDRLARPGPASPAASAIPAAPTGPFPAAAAPADVDPRLMSLWPEALAPLMQRADALGDLGRALHALGPALTWRQRRSAGPTASPGFAQAHGNAMLVGPGGLDPREDLWIGLSLMAPGTRYPDHDHPPEEVYLMLSEGAFLQGASQDWWPRGLGQTLYNSPGIRHAMRAGAAPFLALWCLPI